MYSVKYPSNFLFSQCPKSSQRIPQLLHGGRHVVEIQSGYRPLGMFLRLCHALLISHRWSTAAASVRNRRYDGSCDGG